MAVKSAMHRKTLYQAVVSETLVPALLIILTPVFLMSYVHFAVEKQSNLESVKSQGVVGYLLRVFTEANFRDKQSWISVLGFAVWSAVIPLSIGGKMFLGPRTISGYRPKYIDSGFRYFLISTVFFGAVLLYWPLGWTWYLKLFTLTCSTALFGFIVTALLFVKGVICPSPGIHGSSGNVLFDFYWGLELYPRIGKLWYLKEWAVAFYGMMGWFVVVLICWKAQYEQIGWNWAMATSTVTLAIYMGKFYWWYSGYMNSLDIMYDRAGFYLGWGGIGLMPTFLACNAVYMVENPSDLGPAPCLVMTMLGVSFTFLTYWADIQRLRVREADGNCLVWGRPAKVIRTSYNDATGKKQTSILLASGFWSVTRHPNYVLEFMTNLMWVIPAGLDSLVPYLWVFFLFGIFVQRVGRDDNRCRRKYGRFWEEYCKQVPYVVIPGIF